MGHCEVPKLALSVMRLRSMGVFLRQPKIYHQLQCTNSNGATCRAIPPEPQRAIAGSPG
jgi:hypothetical protein